MGWGDVDEDGNAMDDPATTGGGFGDFGRDIAAEDTFMGKVGNLLGKAPPIGMIGMGARGLGYLARDIARHQVDPTYGYASRGFVTSPDHPSNDDGPDFRIGFGQTPFAKPDWETYLDRYPDVRKNVEQVGGDPATIAKLHYRLHGRREGRTWGPDEDTGTTDTTDATNEIPEPASIVDKFMDIYNPTTGESEVNALNQNLGVKDIWDMYNKGYGDINTARDLAIGDVNRAVAEAGGYYRPYREAGTNALSTLQDKMAAGPGEFETSPGYQWRLNQGINALERASSARGGTGALFDPRLYKELMEYGQGMATEEYDKFLDRYYQSLTPYQWMTGSVGLPSAGASADITMRGGLQNALLRTDAAARTSGMGMDAARSAVSNALAKEGLGTDWARLALTEAEAEKGRGFTGGENALDRALAREMAEKGYDFYRRENTRNQRSSILNSLIGAGGMLAGGLFGGLFG